jgi:hypothetical protein
LGSWLGFLAICYGTASWVRSFLSLRFAGIVTLIVYVLNFESGLDSYQFPARHFGDLAFRIYGHWARYLMNILEATQLLCNVAVIIISNGEALSEASKFKLCYAICCLVWALAGFFLGQIRTLQKFSWLANVAVFINLLIMFITMGAAAHSPPLYSGSVSAAGYFINPKLVTPVNGKYPAVQHSGGLPNSGNFAAAINGLMQAVYSYGGSMIFPEFMAEMRRPRDFLKGMWGAQLFIYLCYMMYGLFIYGYQGQYVQTPSYLGISAYGLQTAGNSLAMFTALIAAALYGNIGIKGKSCTTVFIQVFTLLITVGSYIQQCPHRILQVPTSQHPLWQDCVACDRSHLLVDSVCHWSRHSRLCRFHEYRRGYLYPTIYIHLPALLASWLQYSANCLARGTRLRSQHWQSDH